MNETQVLDLALRLFQASGGLYADEMPVNAHIDLISREMFERFYEAAYLEKPDDAGVEFPVLLTNMKLATAEGNLTLGRKRKILDIPAAVRASRVLSKPAKRRKQRSGSSMTLEVSVSTSVSSGPCQN